MANIVLDFLHNYQTGERRESEPANAYQYDEGHVLEAILPEVITSCEIHYWIRGMEEADAYTPTSITPNSDGSCTVLGNIPNSYFETNGELRIYIVVTDGTASITTYEGKLHICQRSMPDDYVDDDPENEAVRVITEARAAATTATEKAGEAAASAEQAQEILDSIPADYTQMSEDVDTLKADTSTLKEDLADPTFFFNSKLLQNLINKLQLFENNYINYTNGNLEPNSYYSASDYIGVIGGTKYIGYKIGHFAWYDANKAFISGMSSTLNHFAPSNAKYLRVDFSNGNKELAYVNEAVFGLDESEFLVEYPWLVSNRKIDPERLNQYGAYYVNMFNKETAIDGVYVEHTTGERSVSSSYFTSEEIPAKPSTTYMMSRGNRYVAYDENHQYISGGKLSGNNAEFTTPIGTKYLRISNTPLTIKDSLVLAEKSHFPSDYQSYGIAIPWIKPKDKLSKYQDKNMVCFGDSITNMGYTDIIKADCGINAINVGLSSGRYAYSDDSDQYVNAFAFHNIVYSISTGDWTIPDSIQGATGYETQFAHIQDIKAVDFSTIDFVSIAYGTNDFSSATPIDNETNKLDVNTFKGAIRYCLKLLTEKYPHLKIIGVTPCYRFWSENGTILYDSDDHAVGGMYMKQYVDAVNEVYTEYHLPVVNNYNNAGINKYNCLQYFGINDGLHPNANGRAIIGHRIGNGILANY